MKTDVINHQFVLTFKEGIDISYQLGILRGMAKEHHVQPAMFENAIKELSKILTPH